MRIIYGEKVPSMKQIPSGVFLARHRSPTGPLHIVGPNCSSMGSWNAMDLEGRGGPAIGDVFTNLSACYLREHYYPIDQAVTFQNEYSGS